MADATNPYAAPTARVEDAGANSDAERIRREHITHEATVKSIGALYYLGGGMLFLGGLATSFSGGTIGATMGITIAAFGAGQVYVGWGVRAFKRWARIAGTVLSVIGLLGFPIGTLISAYILYLLLSAKGKTVFSDEYQAVIAATPHVKYKTSIVVWIFLAILLGLIGLGVVAAFTGR